MRSTQWKSMENCVCVCRVGGCEDKCHPRCSLAGSPSLSLVYSCASVWFCWVYACDCARARHPLNYRFNFHSKSNVPSVGVWESDKIALILFNPFFLLLSPSPVIMKHFQREFRVGGFRGGGGGVAQKKVWDTVSENIQVVSPHKPPYKATQL